MIEASVVADRLGGVAIIVMRGWRDTKNTHELRVGRYSDFWCMGVRARVRRLSQRSDPLEKDHGTQRAWWHHDTRNGWSAPPNGPGRPIRKLTGIADR